jgi:hypothetical protein
MTQANRIRKSSTTSQRTVCNDEGRNATLSNKRFGILVVNSDVVGGLDKFTNRTKNAAAKSVFGNISKDTFLHVKPGSTGRREMNMETFVAFHPCPHIACWCVACRK